MSDRLLRMIDSKQKIRAFAAETTELAEKARKTHQLSPVAAAALGRSLTAGAMMGAMLKNTSDKLTIQIKGNGPLGGIVVSANNQAKVKGYVYNPEVYLEPNKHGKLDVAGAIGENGYLNVIKDIGLREPYVGYVSLVSGEIAEDFSYYFLKSEQVPSVVALGVLVDTTGEVIASGGYIIQILPDAGDDVIETLENNITKISSVTSYLSEDGKIDDMVREVVGEPEMRVLDTINPEFVCDCSRERMERALISLGREELIKILEKQENIEIECHFCLGKYSFDRSSIENLLEM